MDKLTQSFKDSLIISTEDGIKDCLELGRALILLNNFIDKEKSIILAKFFKAYINKDITWNEFCEYSEIVNRIFIQDIYTLIKIYNKEIVYNGIDERFRIERLIAVGLIYVDAEGTIHSGQYDDNSLNNYSKKFIEIIIKG